MLGSFPYAFFQVELLRHSASAHRHAKEALDNQIRERNLQLVSLRLRLEQAKRYPGSIDIDSDPVTEFCADRIVRDEHMKQLVKENAELAAIIGDLRARLSEASGP